MKGLAFAYDPDGYWVEIVNRGKGAEGKAPKFSLAQTMLRVKDPLKAVEFYEKHLGMTRVNVRHFSDFSLYFLATVPSWLKSSVPEDVFSPEAATFVKETLYPNNIPVLELTHNHGTEKNADFQYLNGNTEGRVGFSCVGFLVEDLASKCTNLEAAGVAFLKRANEGVMKYNAIVVDPDGYRVELLQKGAQAH